MSDEPVTTWEDDCMYAVRLAYPYSVARAPRTLGNESGFFVICKNATPQAPVLGRGRSEGGAWVAAFKGLRQPAEPQPAATNGNQFKDLVEAINGIASKLEKLIAILAK